MAKGPQLYQRQAYASCTTHLGNCSPCVRFARSFTLGHLMRRTLSDEIFSRPVRWKIFISSIMRDHSLDRERRAAAQAVAGTQLGYPWRWETDAVAGPYCAEGICLGHARTCDGLVLIVGARLTPITRKEYSAARRSGVPCYVFAKDGVKQQKDLRLFLARVRSLGTVTLQFRSISELRSHIANALLRFAIDAGRKVNLRPRGRRR